MRGKPIAGFFYALRARITPARAGKTFPVARRCACIQDHPRACGENTTCEKRVFSGKGSPPRVRGKHTRTSCLRASGRITPARAGKTRGWKLTNRAGTDHPRACGENLQAPVITRYIVGSPPRVRGKHLSAPPPHLCMGITPARAGKTAALPYTARPGEDHPRACGENYGRSGESACGEGSPPRVRGKHGETVLQTAPSRITPARAGKTVPHCTRVRRARDHPRACGENASLLRHSSSLPASPPRVRGKRLVNFGRHFCKRITPARAGKTNRKGPEQAQEGDHPRACGENLVMFLKIQIQNGSPPRVRGKLYDHLSGRAPERITPARAGKTTFASAPPLALADHPRACGENGPRQD